MTLRQYYAAAALTGLLAESVWVERAQAARRAFTFADAMIAHEEKEREEPKAT